MSEFHPNRVLRSLPLASSKIVGRISNAGPFSATTEPMLLTISYQDVVLGEMEMPAIELKTGQADIVTSTRFAIKNVDAFQNFSSILLNDADFVWRVQGKTSLKIMNMEIRDLIFDKKILLKGKWCYLLRHLSM